MQKKSFLTSISSKIWFLALFPIVIFPFFAVSLIFMGIQFFDHAIFNKIKGDNEFVKSVIENELVEISKATNAMSNSYRIRNFYFNEKTNQLNEIFHSRAEMSGYDFILITDTLGNIEYANFYKDDDKKIIGKNLKSERLLVTLPENKLFKQIIGNAFLNNETIYGIDSIKIEDLSKLDLNLAQKSKIELLNTKNADPITQKTLDKALFLIAAAPIYNIKNEPVAFTVSAKLLNNNNEIVDKISNLTSRGSGYLNLKTNVTLFLDKTRIATTVIDNKKRATGTQISSKVADIVLNKNKPYLDKAFVVNDFAYTAYEPLKDFSGETIGAIFVGILEGPFQDLKKNIILISLGIILMGLILSTILTSILARKIILPLKNIEDVIVKVRSGDKTARIFFNNQTNDEFNKIKQEFNLLMDQNHKIETQLIQSRENLEILVTLRTGELENANKQLIEANKTANASNQAKSLFLSNMSHELRTPLNAIIGFSHILRKTQLDNKQLNAIEKITTASNHLLALINEVLDLSKIESGKMVLNPELVNIGDLIASIENIFRIQIEQKGLNFNVLNQINSNIFLEIDSLKLKQIIINLLSNALKFTQYGSITLEVKLLSSLDENAFFSHGENFKRPPNQVCLSFKVTDTGIGISKNSYSKIFSPFEQEHLETSKKYGGTGLGLTISKKIAQMMEGDIYVNSELNTGSTFTLICTAIKPFIENINENINMQSSSIIDNTNLNTSQQIKSYEKNSIINSISIDDLIYNFPVEKITPQVLNSINEKLFLSKLEADPNRCTFFEHTLISKINSSKDFSNKKILIVEDNIVNLAIMQELLSELNCQIYSAENGQVAFNLCEQHYFDLIFMDCLMPIMDGYESTKEIRNKSTLNSKTLIFALSANVFKEDIEKSLAAGMNQHLIKPINPIHLFLIIFKAICKN